MDRGIRGSAGEGHGSKQGSHGRIGARNLRCAHAEPSAESPHERGKARAIAGDARMHAISTAFLHGLEIPHEVSATEWSYVDWFEDEIIARADVNDHAFIEMVGGFVRAASRLKTGYPPEVVQFSRALRSEAMRHHRPPAKKAVRLALGRLLQNPVSNSIEESHAENRRHDTIDPDTFSRLLERTGFGWLPSGKTGPA